MFERIEMSGRLKKLYTETEDEVESAAQSSVDISNLSIPDAEEIIEEALSELAFSTDPGLARALRFLALPDTRRSWNYAVKTAAANAGMHRPKAGRPRKMRCGSTLSVSTIEAAGSLQAKPSARRPLSRAKLRGRC